MSHPELQQSTQSASGPPPPQQAPAPHFLPGQKSPFLAGILSLFPGLGNVYNGLYTRGIAFFLIAATLIYLTAQGRRGEEFFGLAIAFVWIFNIIDSVRQASLINYGLAGDAVLADRLANPRAGTRGGGLAVGVILLLVGLFALLDRWFYIDLEWILDLWPVALMGVGAWMVWSWLRDRKAEAGPGGEA